MGTEKGPALKSGHFKTFDDNVFQQNGKPGKETRPEDPPLDKSEKKKRAKKEKEEEEKPLIPGLKPVPFFRLYRFASALDRFRVVVGVLSSFVSGLCFPAMIVLFGRITDSMVSSGGDVSLLLGENVTATAVEVCDIFLGSDDLAEIGAALNTTVTDGIYNYIVNQCDIDLTYDIALFGIGTAALGGIQLVLGYLSVFCLNSAAENQVFRIRSLFLKGILRQDIGWYDTHQTGDFASRITEDLNKMQEGIGEKVGMFIFFMTVFLSSIVNALVHGWQLTLVIMSVQPVLMVAMGVMAKVQSSISEMELQAYGNAGAVAEEVLSSIRTVVAFGGQEKEVERYQKSLRGAKELGIKRTFWSAFGGGVTWFMIFVSYALAFWYGPKLIIDSRGQANPDYDAYVLIIVFFSVLMGAMNVGQAAPYVESFAVARAAAATLFSVIDRLPPIDSSSSAGKRPQTMTGKVEFRNVKFHYPSRPDVPILQGLNFKIEPGQTVALVGSSGCGKSTCIQLIQRFYDTIDGQVLVDGVPVDELNVGWLREHIGVVSQEPILFATTIEENIRFGKTGATIQEIQAASKNANAHDFVIKLPVNYQTLVGDRGAQLSGGQKQRIAIARALIRDPKILLLDEATSALDTQSEYIVQQALDRAREGRTTIIVAHRLTTVRNADKILVLDKGVLAEEGSHGELMAKKGIYYQLVTTQTVSEESDESDESDGRSDGASDADSDAHEGFKKPRSGSLKRGSTERRSSKRKRSRKSETEADEAIPKLKGESEKKAEKLPEPSIARIMQLNAPEWKIILVGILAAALNGGAMPAYGILFGEVLGTLSIEDDDKAREETMKYVYLFLGLGGIAGIAMFLQTFTFGIAGEKLTMRLRRLLFSTMLRQEMGWFDREENATGALCARLSSDASSIQGATGSRAGIVTQSLTSLLAGVTLALYYNWKLGLVAAAFVPMVLAASYFQFKIIFGQDILEKDQIEKSSKAAIEAISNIRTVAGLRKEDHFHHVYIEALRGPHVASIKKSHIRGAVFGMGQSVIFFAYAATMFYGGRLMEEEGLHYSRVFKVAEALIASTMMVGQALAFAPNYNAAKVASARVFKLLDRKTLIDSSSSSGARPPSASGDVRFQAVEFTYPSRPDIQILKRLFLEVKPGQTVALVGSSGCGKSTTIQLLERFYDPTGGSVAVDGTNIKDLNITWVRSKLGIVSQEPILFDRTIAQNIAYGDNFRQVPMEEIIAAAKNANIHNFITSLPQGYETRVGDKGTQLSGGQKQRVAIARALIRNPAVLLLDEATSALDSESEKVVQEALDIAQQGRTCITIAHRLSTIQNADRIYVFHQGQISEYGAHADLMQLKGLYYRLWMQGGGTKNK